MRQTSGPRRRALGALSELTVTSAIQTHIHTYMLMDGRADRPSYLQRIHAYKLFHKLILSFVIEDIYREVEMIDS